MQEFNPAKLPRDKLVAMLAKLHPQRKELLVAYDYYDAKANLARRHESGDYNGLSYLEYILFMVGYDSTWRFSDSAATHRAGEQFEERHALIVKANPHYKGLTAPRPQYPSMALMSELKILAIGGVEMLNRVWAYVKVVNEFISSTALNWIDSRPKGDFEECWVIPNVLGSSVCQPNFTLPGTTCKIQTYHMNFKYEAALLADRVYREARDIPSPVFDNMQWLYKEPTYMYTTSHGRLLKIINRGLALEIAQAA